jgi:thymidine kinase
MGSDSDMDIEYIYKNNGKLELIIGNMFSGKSTELIRRINKTKSIKKRILVINHIGDNRYSQNSISTHDQLKVNSLKLNTLSELNVNFIPQYDSFFIDEGQFFTDLYSYVKDLVDIHKKHVVVSGLDGDFNRNAFGEMTKLIPICDTVDKLYAYCNKCNNDTLAPFTKLVNVNGVNVNNVNVINIGGSDKYIPVCRYHYLC